MKKIVWISSYPKSGNTFLRAMLSAFFYSKDGTFKQDYLKNISEFPRDFFDFKPKNNFLNEVKEYEKIQKKISNADKEVVFLKTHSANLIINETFPDIQLNPFVSVSSYPTSANICKPTQIPSRGFLLFNAKSFKVSTRPLIVFKASIQLLKEPCPGKTTLSLELIFFKSEVTSILPLPLATSLNEFITELMFPDL